MRAHPLERHEHRFTGLGDLIEPYPATLGDEAHLRCRLRWSNIMFDWSAPRRSGVRSPSFDVDRVVAIDHSTPTKREQRRERLEGRPEARNPGEDALRAEHHLAALDVVLRAMPRTHQATGLIDTAVGEVGVQMSAASRDREQLAVGVPHRVAARAAHGTGREFGRRSYFNAVGHQTAPRLASRSSVPYSVDPATDGLSQCADQPDERRNLTSWAPRPASPRAGPGPHRFVAPSSTIPLIGAAVPHTNAAGGPPQTQDEAVEHDDIPMSWSLADGTAGSRWSKALGMDARRHRVRTARVHDHVQQLSPCSDRMRSP